MNDVFHTPTSNKFDIQEFIGGSNTVGNNWRIWNKPTGFSQARIFLLGSGGSGGSGSIGALSNVAGGGGGGSGGQTIVNIPLSMLPDTLYISLGNASNGAGFSSYVSIYPNTTANNVLAIANGGGIGGTAAGATAGTAGTAGAIATVATMPFGFSFASVLAGQAGTIGGTTGNAGNITLPVTGLKVTGGTGGGGMAAAGGTVGQKGGDISGVGTFLSSVSSLNATVATNAPSPGNIGLLNNGTFYGGLGSEGTHSSATTTGLAQSNGGNGMPGCGGGGVGAGLTGSTAGVAGLGGPGYCLITCF